MWPRFCGFCLFGGVVCFDLAFLNVYYGVRVPVQDRLAVWGGWSRCLFMLFVFFLFFFCFVFLFGFVFRFFPRFCLLMAAFELVYCMLPGMLLNFFSVFLNHTKVPDIPKVEHAKKAWEIWRCCRCNKEKIESRTVWRCAYLVISPVLFYHSK